jgi:hypothetical protein
MLRSICDNERYVQEFVVHSFGFTVLTVLPKEFAVIRCEDYERVLVSSGVFEMGDDSVDLVEGVVDCGLV